LKLVKVADHKQLQILVQRMRVLSHGLWDNFKLRAEEDIKLPHGKQAGARKAFHAGVAGQQVLCHLLHHRRAPGAFALPGIQLPANVPIQAQQLGIHRQHGASLRALDALLDRRQRLAVIGVVGDFTHTIRLLVVAKIRDCSSSYQATV
jgi:hypothetical protein